MEISLVPWHGGDYSGIGALWQAERGDSGRSLDTATEGEYIPFMPSTTVHIPEDTLSRLDEIAKRRGVSRNRVVNEALEQAVIRDKGEWPQGFFERSADGATQAEIEEATRELERTVVASRRNRGAVLL